MEVNECINFMLTSTQNAVFNYFKRRLQDFDTTPSQYALLRCLWKQEVQTPSQLAHELHLDTSTITGMLGRLEKKDLIERTYNQEDRRSVHVRLREEGKVLWSRSTTSSTRPTRRSCGGISAEDAAKLRQQLLLIEANAKDCLNAERGEA